MKPVAVVGGGISGLTAAFRLQQFGFPVTLYEKQDRAGGVIRSGREQGFLTESGPTSIRCTALVNQLISDLGLGPSKVIANSNANIRYLVRNGELNRLPSSPVSALTTPLLSFKGKLRILAEPFISRGRDADEDLGAFVTRRLGKELLECAVDPLVGGMYAGRPENLSARSAFPKLYELEQRSGSIFLGAISKAFSGNKAPKVSPDPFSFSGGVQTLTDTLQSKLNSSVRLSKPVVAVSELESGWSVCMADGETCEHSAVILAAPAPEVAKLKLATRAGVDLSRLARVRYSSVVRIVFGFAKSQMKQPREGFGFLVPRREDSHLLGSVFCSSVYAGSAPEGHVSFLCFLGGARRPELVDMSEEELIARALPELQRLVGIDGAPVFQSYLKVPQAIPQYEVGHGEICALLDHAEAAANGLYFAGNYRAGISVGDALTSGWKTAERLAEVGRG